jgi:hypothetical protein
MFWSAALDIFTTIWRAFEGASAASRPGLKVEVLCVDPRKPTLPRFAGGLFVEIFFQDLPHRVITAGIT